MTIDSRATVSGSAKRMATSAMDWVMRRSSCEREAMWASTKMKAIGTTIAPRMPNNCGAAAPRPNHWVTSAPK